MKNRIENVKSFFMNLPKCDEYAHIGFPMAAPEVSGCTEAGISDPGSL